MSAGWSSPTRPAIASVGDRARCPTGMEQRIVGEGRVRRLGHAQRAGHEVDEALAVVEVVRPCRSVPGGDLGRTGQDEAEPPPLVGPFPVVLCPIPLADLEDRDVRPALAEIGGGHLEEAAQQPLAHHGVLARQRVRHRDRATAGGALPGDDGIIDGRKALDHGR